MQPFVRMYMHPTTVNLLFSLNFSIGVALAVPDVIGRDAHRYALP